MATEIGSYLVRTCPGTGGKVLSVHGPLGVGRGARALALLIAARAEYLGCMQEVGLPFVRVGEETRSAGAKTVQTVGFPEAMGMQVPIARALLSEAVQYVASERRMNRLSDFVW